MTFSFVWLRLKAIPDRPPRKLNRYLPGQRAKAQV